ncbi:DUF6624 domain-containing protein [Streptomyces sp. NPDC003435]
MTTTSPQHRELARELLDWADRAEKHWDRRVSEQLDGVQLGQGRHTDYANAKRLKFIITDLGWPGDSLVGPEAARAAWRLALHADDHPGFQVAAARLMRHAADKGDASLRGWAHLHDRALLNSRRRQDFGTQYEFGPAGPQACPVRDPGSLDARRAAVGLPPAAAALAAVRARLASNLTGGMTTTVTATTLAEVA